MLKIFCEKGVGWHVWAVGNVAVALAGCEKTENGERIMREISTLLPVKDPEGLKIAAQAWDSVDDIDKAFADAGLPGDP